MRVLEALHPSAFGIVCVCVYTYMAVYVVYSYITYNSGLIVLLFIMSSLFITEPIMYVFNLLYFSVLNFSLDSLDLC